MATEISLQVKDAFGAVLKAIDYKTTQKTLRKAVRKEARNVVKVAKEYVKSTKAGKKKRSLSEATSGIENGLHSWVYPDKGGTSMIVTPVPHGKKGLHLNRQGLEKPILMWAETGTVHRHRGPKKVHKTKYVSALTGKTATRYYRRGAYTGQMPKYGFIEKAEADVAQGVETRIFSDLEKGIVKQAKKQGLL